MSTKARLFEPVCPIDLGQWERLQDAAISKNKNAVALIDQLISDVNSHNNAAIYFGGDLFNVRFDELGHVGDPLELPDQSISLVEAAQGCARSLSTALRSDRSSLLDEEIHASVAGIEALLGVAIGLYRHAENVSRLDRKTAAERSAS